MTPGIDRGTIAHIVLDWVSTEKAPRRGRAVKFVGKPPQRIKCNLIHNLVRLSASRFKFGRGAERNINSSNDVKLKDRDSERSGQRQGDLRSIDLNRNQMIRQTVMTEEAESKHASRYRCSIGWNPEPPFPRLCPETLHRISSGMSLRERITREADGDCPQFPRDQKVLLSSEIWAFFSAPGNLQVTQTEGDKEAIGQRREYSLG
jgi:hypothetical protein